jgi:hypothetical protein
MASADAPLKIDTVMSSPKSNYAEDMPLKLNICIGKLDNLLAALPCTPLRVRVVHGNT